MDTQELNDGLFSCCKYIVIQNCIHCIVVYFGVINMSERTAIELSKERNDKV